MASTQKTLERVPLDKWDWKPQEKSGSLGWMAWHVATLPGFTTATIRLPELALENASMPKADKPSDLLPAFAKSSQEARAAVASVSDAQLQEMWALKRNGTVIFSMPRYDVLRGMCFNHLVHHRGQLTMYLRQLNVSVPGLYGPSADEKGM